MTLRELESSAEALRNLYNGALQKFNEINRAQPQAHPVQDARIITRAAPSLHKDAKKPLAALGGSVVLGLLLGAAAALARDLAGGAFRTPGQVKSVTDIYCGIMPAVQPHRSRYRCSRATQGREQSRNTFSTRPTRGSRRRFAASRCWSMRLIAPTATRSSASCPRSPTRARRPSSPIWRPHMAATSPVRLLVIDCDLHRRRLTTRLAPEAREGLIEALDDPSRLDELVCKRERSGSTSCRARWRRAYRTRPSSSARLRWRSCWMQRGRPTTSS